MATSPDLTGIIAACFVVFAAFPSHGESSCQLRQVARLPVEFDEQTGLPSVTIKIGGQDVSMVVSSESVVSALRPDVVAKLNGKPEWKEDMGIQLKMGGKDIMRYVILNGISLGKPLIPEFTFVLVPKDIQLKTDGLLGANIFMNFDVELDFLHNSLNLFEHYNCTLSPVYWSNIYGQADLMQKGLHYMMFGARLNGVNTQSILATDFLVSSMPRRMAAEQFAIRKEELAPSCPSDAKHSDKFASLDIDGLSINNPEINTNCDYPHYMSAKTAQPFLAIGINHLKKLRLYVAWQQRKIYFTAATATK